MPPRAAPSQSIPPSRSSSPLVANEDEVSPSRVHNGRVLIILVAAQTPFFDSVDELQQHVSNPSAYIRVKFLIGCKGYQRTRHSQAQGLGFTTLYMYCFSRSLRQSAAINTVSGVNMTTRRQMLKIKVSLLYAISLNRSS